MKRTLSAIIFCSIAACSSGELNPPSCTDGSCEEAQCGNGVVEGDEICDGNCPETCDDDDECTSDSRTGIATECNVVCVNEPTSTCVSGDGCCGESCTVEDDCDCDPAGIRIIDVWASGDDGNVPENALDDDLETRWASHGDGEWIAFELSCITDVDSVSVATYLGKDRRSRFDIEVSTDNETWTVALDDAETDGKGLDLQRFPFPAVTARYVRLTGYGSSSGTGWNSYTEIRIGDLPIDLDGSCATTDECGVDICGVDHGDCEDGYFCDSGTCRVETGDIFNIFFEQDFNDNSVGFYDFDTFQEDWPGVGTPDPREHNWECCSRLDILEESDNRFLRHGFEPGDFLTGPNNGIQWMIGFEPQEEVYLSFLVRFSDLFVQQDLDGKLPGFRSSIDNTGAGERPGSDDGFTSRYMFGNGRSDAPECLGISFYVYHQEMSCKDCDTETWTPCDECPDELKLYYGDGYSVPFDFEANVWYSVTQRLVMNDPWTSNGLIESFIDGQLISSHQGMRFRDTTVIQIDRLNFANFLGGSGDVPTSSGWIDFDDVVIFNYTDEADAPHGLVPSESGRNILIP